MNPAPLPIRLRVSHRAALLTHFLALGPEDRRLRFGASLNDAAIEAYVDRIDFTHDGAFGIQDDALRLMGAVHVAGLGETAELGLSVLEAFRGKGLGDALFGRAVTFLRNRGAREVMVHCLSENAAMMHLAGKHHMRVDREGGEADARLALLPATMDSYVTEWLTDQQAEALQAIRHQGIFARAILKPR